MDGDGIGVAPTTSSGPRWSLSDQDAGDGTDVGEPEAATNGTVANDDVASGKSIVNRRRVFHWMIDRNERSDDDGKTYEQKCYAMVYVDQFL